MDLFKIRKGSQVFVTLKNGRRVSGRALGSVRRNRAGETAFTLSYMGRKGTERIFVVDIADAIVINP